MLGFKKNQQEGNSPVNARLVKKLMGHDSGRRVFGFACSPDIPAKLKLLAGQLQVPIFALVEHALQLAAGLIAKMAANPEESALLRKHLVEVHVEARTVEKIGVYDEDMAKRLNEERLQRFEIDKAAHQIVIHFMRKGLSPNEIAWCVEYGMHCRIVASKGMPLPKDLPPDE